MDRIEIFEKLNEIFQEVLDNDQIALTETTCSSDIDEWDSLSQVILLARIQDVFKIRFRSADTIKWQNVGEMVDTIISQCSLR